MSNSGHSFDLQIFTDIQEDYYGRDRYFANGGNVQKAQEGENT